MARRGVLLVQEDVADKVMTMLSGAMAELRIGAPDDLATDVGPVIDEEALEVLNKHRDHLDKIGQKIAVTPTDKSLTAQGHFFAPCAYEIPSMDKLGREVFGPILHIVRYKAADIDKIITAINDTGYGLTLGVHSRIESFQRKIVEYCHVGNAYVNRGMTGAVVGSQPFGGRGLSGTGPKAGGPQYLYAFSTEKAISIDTTAAGGNASLVSLSE